MASEEVERNTLIIRSKPATKNMKTDSEKIPILLKNISRDRREWRKRNLRWHSKISRNRGEDSMNRGLTMMLWTKNIECWTKSCWTCRREANMRLSRKRGG